MGKYNVLDILCWLQHYYKSTMQSLYLTPPSLRLQVVILTGIVAAAIFMATIIYARHKGLIGTWFLLNQ